MATNVRRYLKYCGIVVGIAILIPALYVGFLYLSYLDKEVTAGTAYGFTIGESKANAYAAAQSKFRRGEITGIDTIRSRDEELKRFPEINGNESYHTVSEVRDWFADWNHWSLWLGGASPTLLAIVTFEGDHVSGVGEPGALDETWRPADADGVTIRVGQSYAQVYESLEALSRAPGYESLVVDTGWMARRQPVRFDDSEYRFVANYNEWTLFVGGSRLNNIRLTFDQGRLLRVHRHRQYFELP